MVSCGTLEKAPAGVEGHDAAHQDHPSDEYVISGTHRTARYGAIPFIRRRARLLSGTSTEIKMADAQDEPLQRIQLRLILRTVIQNVKSSLHARGLGAAEARPELAF